MSHCACPERFPECFPVFIGRHRSLWWRFAACRYRRSCTIAAALCLWITIAAEAQITLDANFESGALDLANSSVNGNQISLRGVESWTAIPNRYRWVYFRASGVNGLQPAFQIGEIGSNEFLGSLDDHRFFYSYDQQTWMKFDNGSGPNGNYLFSNNAAFTQDDVFVSYSIPHPYSRTQQKVSTWASSPFVSPTNSANADLVVATIPNTTPFGSATLDLYGLQITDLTAPGPKAKVLLVAGNHSAEMGGNWVLEGTVDFLLGDDPRASRLRQSAEILVYPQLDPLGRMEGFYRGNSQNPASDHNRFWDSPVSGDNGGFAEIDLFNSALSLDTAGNVDYALDYHGFFSPGDDFIYTDSVGAASQFLDSLFALEPDINLLLDNSTTPAGIFELWAKTPDGFNAEFSFTPEFGPGDFIADYGSVGQSYAIALYDAIAPEVNCDFTEDTRCDMADLDLMQSVGPIAPGIPATGNEQFDVNGDGMIDLADRDQWLADAAIDNNLDSTYKLGDANLDGTVDSTDFMAWNAAKFTTSLLWSDGNFNSDGVVDGRDFLEWNANKGIGAEGVATVPEPGTGWLLMLAVALLRSAKASRFGL